MNEVYVLNALGLELNTAMLKYGLETPTCFLSL